MENFLDTEVMKPSQNNITEKEDLREDILYGLSSVYLSIVILMGIVLNSNALAKLIEVTKVSSVFCKNLLTV
jgi:hypothetical protein